MRDIRWKQRLPGWVATGLFTLTTGLWVFWGTAEMYYEGWGNPFPAPLAYLIPGAVCLLATVLVLRWPRVGGWILIAGGWLLVAGCWLLVTGCWLLIASIQLRVSSIEYRVSSFQFPNLACRLEPVHDWHE